MTKDNHAPTYAANRFSIAPMLDWTDRHCRYFHRLLTKETLLYTEMVTTGAIIHGKGDYLAYSEEEHPVALQLGGSDPAALAHCAKLAEQRGYDEINLNVGCPSDRVQNGMFGACLMGQATLVADCIKAMRDVVSIPVTVKTRIGIDDQDSYAFLCDFIQTVAGRGECDMFTIHARKAWLSGLSPKENREVPPLDYPRVYQLKRDFPALTIAINGGVKTLEEAQQHLQHLDGVMMGARGVPESGHPGAGRQRTVRRADRSAGQRGDRRSTVSVHRARAVQRHLSRPHHPPHPRFVPGRAGRAPVASPPERERPQAGRRCAGGGAGAGAGASAACGNGVTHKKF